MKTFSFLWTAKLQAAIGKAAPKAGYHMSLVAEDVIAVLQGMDVGTDGARAGRAAGGPRRPSDSAGAAGGTGGH